MYLFIKFCKMKILELKFQLLNTVCTCYTVLANPSCRVLGFDEAQVLIHSLIWFDLDVHAHHA